MISGDVPQAEASGSGFPYICNLNAVPTNLPMIESLLQLESDRDELLDLCREHGAILFQNTGAESAEDFDAMIRAFRLPNFPYEHSLSNAVRVVRTERVFTANEAPSDARIFLHHEMAQTPIFPSRLFFFCQTPATTGGATPICRSDTLLLRLEKEAPQFVADCAERGLRYTHTMPGDDDARSGMGRSWRSTFRAASREDCEDNMARLGYTGIWNADGSLTATTPVLSGVKQLEDGRRVFFNQLIAAYSGFANQDASPDDAITFGDGTKLPYDQVMLACELADQLSYDIQWQTGQMALVDNLVVMHGRRGFTGPRSILASLVA